MRTRVGDWMTRDPITIDAGATVIEAIKVLKERQIRRLPVVKDGKLVGLVTEKMLLSCAPGPTTLLDAWEVHYLLATTPVSSVMNPRPHTVPPDTRIADCAQIINDRKLNGITVVDEKGDLVGILTTTNALEALIWYSRQTPGA
jgi:acetoin utilization protein AcuB